MAIFYLGVLVTQVRAQAPNSMSQAIVAVPITAVLIVPQVPALVVSGMMLPFARLVMQLPMDVQIVMPPPVVIMNIMSQNRVLEPQVDVLVTTIKNAQKMWI